MGRVGIGCAVRLLLTGMLGFTASPTITAACEDLVPVQALLDTLSGDWKGRATVTPVGPLPYDISFTRRGPHWIYGQAVPGAAIHHWGFYCEDSELWMRFFSTFRGNRTPILLRPVSIKRDEILFRASEPAFLAVSVRAADDAAQFEVLHHGKRHVLIRLQRPE